MISYGVSLSQFLFKDASENDFFLDVIGTKKKELADQIKNEVIPKIVVKNLTTQEPIVYGFKEEWKEYSQKNLKERVCFLYQYAEQHSKIIKRALFGLAFSVWCVAITCLFVKYHLDYYDDVIHRRLVHVGSEGVVVSLNTFYKDVFFNFGYFVLGSYQAAKILVGGLSESLNEMSFFFKQFSKNSWHLRCKPSTDASSFNGNFLDLANDSDENFIRDPITLEDIDKKWASAPRFIQVGSYLFPITSLLPRLFRSLDDEGNCLHPIEERSLTEVEQEKLIKDLSLLFLIDEDKVLDLWNPYLCLNYKNSNKQKLLRKKNPELFVDKTPQEKKEIMIDLLLDEQVAEEWKEFSGLSRLFIKPQVKEDLFVNNRIKNFLSCLSKTALNAEIKLNEQTTSTLKEVLDQAHNATYSFKDWGSILINFITNFG